MSGARSGSPISRARQAWSGLRTSSAGRSLLILADGQLTAALALIELDGVARRLVIGPPDITPQQVEAVIADSEADALIVGPEHASNEAFGLPAIRCNLPLTPWSRGSEEALPTEWALLTSGTVGPPKMVVHDLRTLSGAFNTRAADAPVIWSTFYDIRRYGGLQIFLRAMMCGASLVLSKAGECPAGHLRRLGERGVTHMSGTPSHWRRALMVQVGHDFRPRYVRLSGEVVDQAVLDALRAAFPAAAIGHAFASTEAGVAFDVDDGLEGFPADFEGDRGGVEIEIQDGSLCVRSPRTAHRYLGRAAPALKDERGFVHTRDMVTRRGERWFFAGRGDGVVNVGGLKVHPEEVEAVINTHELVRMSLVRGRRNPITGAIIVAEVVLNQKTNDGDDKVRGEIMEICRNTLDVHKVPAMIRFVETLEISAGGKLVRRHA